LHTSVTIKNIKAMGCVAVIRLENLDKEFTKTLNKNLYYYFEGIWNKLLVW
jgi:hypothetical protein